MRVVQVVYSVPIPGLDTRLQMTNRVLLVEGDTDESDIPAILAVKMWANPRLDFCVRVESVKPALSKNAPRPRF